MAHTEDKHDRSAAEQRTPVRIESRPVPQINVNGTWYDCRAVNYHLGGHGYVPFIETLATHMDRWGVVQPLAIFNAWYFHEQERIGQIARYRPEVVAEKVPTLRRVPERTSRRDALMAKFHARGTALARVLAKGDTSAEKRLWDEERHDLVLRVTKGQTASSKDLFEQEVSVAVDLLTRRLEALGYDVAADDAAYTARQELRYRLFNAPAEVAA